VVNFSNCYVLGREGVRDALLIDPGIFDEGLLRLLEGNGFYPRHVLITHAHQGHVSGVRTLRKIYDPVLYALEPDALEFPAERIAEAHPLQLAGFTVRVIATPGHSQDSACFQIDRMLFTGDTLLAGSVGEADTEYEKALLLASVREKLLSLERGLLLFPGHGPPSTLEIEKRFNPHLRE
jgi:glyoxylase-like metal-dependent hydrolase (beta-lactamase superfamily II)